MLFVALPPLHAQGACQPVDIHQKVTTSSASVIQGSIQNRVGALIAGLTLTLTGNELKRTITTDDKGQFHFDSVPSGKYSISIEHTAGTAKRTEVQCDTNGVCTVTFVLKPPRSAADCRVTRDDTRDSRMGGTY